MSMLAISFLVEIENFLPKFHLTSQEVILCYQHMYNIQKSCLADRAAPTSACVEGLEFFGQLYRFVGHLEQLYHFVSQLQLH